MCGQYLVCPLAGITSACMAQKRSDTRINCLTQVILAQWAANPARAEILSGLREWFAAWSLRRDPQARKLALAAVRKVSHRLALVEWRCTRARLKRGFCPRRWRRCDASRRHTEGHGRPSAAAASRL